MHRFRQLLCFGFVCVSALLIAESKNPADYPLRIHIFTRNQTTWYHNRFNDESRGDGRANLFESSEPKGIDFTYDCSNKIKASFGYETYPAKWKKPGQELVVLFPVFGKSGAYFTCNLKTDVKDFAYFAHNGRMGSEPISNFKAWMTKHEYDPEHGKDTPVRNAAPADQAAPLPSQ